MTFLISFHSKILFFSLFGSRQLDDPLWSTICLINKMRESASCNSVMLVMIPIYSILKIVVKFRSSFLKCNDVFNSLACAAISEHWVFIYLCSYYLCMFGMCTYIFIYLRWILLSVTIKCWWYKNSAKCPIFLFPVKEQTVQAQHSYIKLHMSCH